MNDHSLIAPPLPEDGIKALRKIVNELSSYKGQWYEVKGGEKDSDGSIQFPYTVGAPVVNTAASFLYDHNLVLNFDWGRWDEGRQFFINESPKKYEQLSRIDALKLLTAIVRNDRFNDGAWARLFEQGAGQNLFKRLLVIEEEIVEQHKRMNEIIKKSFPDMSQVKPSKISGAEKMIQNLRAQADNSKELITNSINIYLDIDGVLLANDLKPANHSKEFLKKVIDLYPNTTYWLTTHCQGDASVPIKHIGHLFDDETVVLMKKIKPTTWETAKTRGIDFSKPFLWFDDNIFHEEKQTLLERKVFDNLITVDLKKDPDQLAKFLDDFPIPVNN